MKDQDKIKLDADAVKRAVGYLTGQPTINNVDPEELECLGQTIATTTIIYPDGTASIKRIPADKPTP